AVEGLRHAAAQPQDFVDGRRTRRLRRGAGASNRTCPPALKPPDRHGRYKAVGERCVADGFLKMIGR
ncbi:MAG TPA: hypothetical protein VHY37_03850, partial [Tepidisphaeraceae bacterium]|nr:hypothetical protein [Tepidisphaeraceae bacterium]